MLSNNPFTEEAIEVPSNNSEELLQSFNFQKENQKKWAETPLKERLSYIEKFSEELNKREEELAKILTKEMGKPFKESLNEIRGARSRIKFFLKNSEESLSPRDYSRPGLGEEIHFEPLGVIGNISAWNYPYLIGVNVFIPALICGNCVVYKPSEFTSLTGLEIQKIFNDVGLPPYAFQVAIGGKDVGELLLKLPLDGVFFTGSYKTGAFIHNQVSPKLIPVGLELGGKDPLYVTDDLDDISQVAEAACEGVFYNNGQSCCSVERIYVHEKVYKEFLEKFKKSAEGLKTGDPMGPETTQGPLTRKDHVSYLEGQVQDALSKGAEVVFRGEAPPKKGYFFPPTVLKNVNHKMEIMKEESFGPIIGIQCVSNDEEAIQLMNDTSYGLTSSVFSKDERRGRDILSQINSGTGYLNCCDRVSPYLPWSGRKNSGLGSTLSFLGIQAFCQPKAYHIKST